MKRLETGGAAAASILRRLQEAEERIRWAEVSPEAMLICREEELMALLLGWTGADAALGPAVDGLAASAEPVREDEARVSGRPGAFAGASRPAGREGAVVASSRPAPMGFPPDADVLLQRVAALLEEAAEPVGREGSVLETGTPPPSRFPPMPPEPGRRPPGGVLTAEEAGRRLAAAMASDEGTSRGWHQPVSPATGFSPESTMASPWDEPGGGFHREEGASVFGLRGESRGGLQSIDGNPGPRFLPRGTVGLGGRDPFRATSTGEVPWRQDPVSMQLQEAADRAMTVTATGWRDSPASSVLRPRAFLYESASPPSWPAPAQAPPAEQTIVEASRQSGLRRLASLGETVEPGSVSPKGAPDGATPAEGWRRPRRALPETLDLGREVADIFRREALRHGIVPEEDAP